MAKPAEQPWPDDGGDWCGWGPLQLAAPLLRAKASLRFFGSDRGGMFVTLPGRASDGTRSPAVGGIL